MKKSFLKYPVTHIEDFSTTEKKKLLDAVFYFTEEDKWDIFWDKIFSFLWRK